MLTMLMCNSPVWTSLGNDNRGNQINQNLHWQLIWYISALHIKVYDRRLYTNVCYTSGGKKLSIYMLGEFPALDLYSNWSLLHQLKKVTTKIPKWQLRYDIYSINDKLIIGYHPNLYTSQYKKITLQKAGKTIGLFSLFQKENH